MVGAPPVVRLITQFERCLMTFRNGAKASGLWSGWPVFGLRACRCTMAAPASAASTAASAISCGVTGSAFDIEGVWIAPVTAQVMMTLRAMVICLFFRECWDQDLSPHLLNHTAQNHGPLTDF